MAGGVVLGKRRARDSLDRFSLSTFSTSLKVNDVVVTGSTSECPGTMYREREREREREPYITSIP